MPAFNFASSIGLAPLPDVGKLAYNGATFSCLSHTTVTGEAVEDEANRTIIYTDLQITVDAIVTLDEGDETTDASMEFLCQLLSQQGGQLTYSGKGYGDLVINPPGKGGTRDVAWGPIPKVLEFIPLGGSRSAKIKWTVRTKFFQGVPSPSAGFPPTCQFNMETEVGYDPDGYSSLTVSGTLEIPMTRATVTTRAITQTVDDFRQIYLDRVANSFDLMRFKIVNRSFHVSRDKRTMTWSFRANELAWMGNPTFAMTAKGEFTATTQNKGMVLWTCHLSGTYTIRKDQPRRFAWFSFLCLLQVRMQASGQGLIPGLGNNQPGPQQAPPVNLVPPLVLGPTNPLASLGISFFVTALANAKLNRKPNQAAFLTNFRFREGLYEDSRTTSFDATWTLVSTLPQILTRTGIWRTSGIEGGRRWASSVRNVSGWTSWLQNRLDASQDAIIDLGGGAGV